MTRGDLRVWFTMSLLSGQKWIVDDILFFNQKIMLLYCGTASGKFIEIYKDGNFSLGSYYGAYSDITDASFQVEFNKSFDNGFEAVNQLNNILGTNFENLFSRMK